jgi:hypothetical protein
MGVAAQRVTNQLSDLADAVQPNRVSDRSQKAEDMTLLLMRLGQLVSECGEDFSALRNNAEFWDTIQKLQRTRRAQFYKRSARRGQRTPTIKQRKAKPRGQRRGKAGPVIDAEEIGAETAAEATEETKTAGADETPEAQNEQPSEETGEDKE